MKKNKIIISIAALVIIIGGIYWGFFRNCCLPGKVANISVEKLKIMQSEKADFVLIDVRTNGERSQGYIANSLFIPVQELPNRISEIEKYKNKKVALYCKAGVRSTRAGNILVGKGFNNILNITGGIDAWIESGGKIVK